MMRSPYHSNVVRTRLEYNKCLLSVTGLQWEPAILPSLQPTIKKHEPIEHLDE